MNTPLNLFVNKVLPKELLERAGELLSEVEPFVSRFLIPNTNPLPVGLSGLRKMTKESGAVYRNTYTSTYPKIMLKTRVFTPLV